jgi:hypothetical protein
MSRKLFGILPAVCTGLVALSGATAIAAPDSAVMALAGRWAGEGTMTPPAGPPEIFACVVTYFPNTDGSQVKQNLRCKGPQTKFDAATNLSIDGGKVTGDWQDNVYALAGTVTGTMTASGFDLVLDSEFFQAKMIVVSSPCEQSVKVVPDDTSEMKEMAAVLKRC